ncbi:MAG: regulatory protein RecX [Anaerolineae bacterium]
MENDDYESSPRPRRKGHEVKKAWSRQSPEKAPALNLRGGQVTGLEPQAKHPNRYNLFIDNHFALGLSALVALKVRTGQELTAEQVEALAAAEQLERAHEYALRKLESRPRSENEIRRALAGKKYASEIVEQVVRRLQEARLLSDREFAKFWVENREGFKPRSARALKYELRQKGVPPDEITRAVKHLDEDESAYRAARPKAERWKTLDAEAFKRKVSGFLARRGFDYQVTRSTVARLWKEIQGEELSETDDS